MISKPVELEVDVLPGHFPAWKESNPSRCMPAIRPGPISLPTPGHPRRAGISPDRPHRPRPARRRECSTPFGGSHPEPFVTDTHFHTGRRELRESAGIDKGQPGQAQARAKIKLKPEAFKHFLHFPTRIEKKDLIQRRFEPAAALSGVT